MMTLKRIYILGIIILLCIPVKAQHPTDTMPNGTITNMDMITLIQNNLADEAQTKVPGNPVNLLITAYDVKNANGNLSVDIDYLQNVLVDVNKYFEETGIQFTLLRLDSLEDYNYNMVEVNTSKQEMTTIHYEQNTINLYLVNQVVDTLTSTYYFGKTFYPSQPGKDHIFLAKGGLNAGHLSQLLGNYFGLLPTHDTLGGAELVDGSNCQSSGDFICDTYADPNLLGKVSPECIFGEESASRDAQDEWYVPSVANIMAASMPHCRCVFSDEQKRRIYYYYRNYRGYLR